MADDVLTKDDLAQIEKDTAAAKQAIASQELDRVRDQARKEAEREFSLKQELDSQKRASEELSKKLQEQVKAAEEQQKKFQAELDALKTTKAPVNVVNPFATESKPSMNPKNMSMEQKMAIEEASKELFITERSKPI